MAELHTFYLSLGSNIEPAKNLADAIGRLRAHGRILELSSAWESRAVGSSGPNFLNVCVSVLAPFDAVELKNQVLLPVESALGRIRTDDKNAPRTIDIDVLMMDGTALNLERWSFPFVIMPMAELAPQLPHPVTGIELQAVADQVQQSTWIVKRPAVLAASPTPPPD